MKRNGHPDPATLALLAGSDLNWFQAWRTERHVARCSDCRRRARRAYQDVRDGCPNSPGLPDLQWNRIAVEMRANIRLGLAAGECVRESTPPATERIPLFAGARAALALARVLALVVAGLVLERPTPPS